MTGDRAIDAVIIDVLNRLDEAPLPHSELDPNFIWWRAQMRLQIERERRAMRPMRPIETLLPAALGVSAFGFLAFTLSVRFITTPSATDWVAFFALALLGVAGSVALIESIRSLLRY